MTLRILLSVGLPCLFAGLSAQAAGTVTLTLDSPQHDTEVSPGSEITWTITATVSTGDNLGLALVLVDIEQSPGNPQTFDLLPAADVPAGMVQFSRPQGISNPGTGSPGSGYGGTPAGLPGALNLAQIGGSQNTFGMALADDLGVDVDVEVGIAQSPGGQAIASGCFAAPPAAGVYTLTLNAATANTLVEINAAPQHSAVGEADVQTPQSTITFTVVQCPQDLNGDGTVNASDLAQVLGSWGPCPDCPADLNHDGVVNPSDLAQVLGAWGPC